MNKMNKYLSFAKNSAIAIAIMAGVGVGTSEIAKEFTENGKIIGAAATAAEYISGWVAFLPLQARDNKDIYTENGKFNTKKFIWDNIKYGASFLAFDITYLLTRPLLQDYFIRQGNPSGNSSLYTDGIFVGAGIPLAFGLAKLTGVIKTKKKLEDNLE